MVYLLEIKFSIGYGEAVDFHPGAGHIFSNILLIYTIVQAMVYLLEIKFSIEYDEAIAFIRGSFIHTSLKLFIPTHQTQS